jgi:hypothetical protein
VSVVVDEKAEAKARDLLMGLIPEVVKSHGGLAGRVE